MKAQFATEYLITYGFAILIIAAVLVALFELGLFNGTAIKAQPGSCSVTRNQFGGTVLSGSCTNQDPEFVAKFNGADSYIVSTAQPEGLPSVYGPQTISAWINVPSTMSTMAIGGLVNATVPSQNLLMISSGSLTTSGGVGVSAPYSYTGGWHMVTYTFDGSTATLYVDGVEQGSASGSPASSAPASNILLGTTGSSDWFSGEISNVQVYGASLSANSVMELYQEGMGGPPADLGDLAAWWPLNGNAEDYSGYGNSGAVADISFVST